MAPLWQDPNWPRASEWIASSNQTGGLGIIGAPLRLGSISPGRCDLAPGAIRDALLRFSPFHVDTQLDLRTLPVKDYGDAGVASLPPAEAFEPLKAAFRTVLAECSVAVILGGDNAVTRPGIHSLGVPLRRCALLTVDAHLDLRDLDRGLTNGNPVRALLRDGLPGSNIVQVGIQSFANSRAYFEIARAEGITVVTADTVRREGIRATMDRALSTLADRADVIYVDFDIDVMDRALAPATPGSRPGGLATWEARQAAFLCGIHPKVRAVDFVEMDPSNDIAEVTAMAAAACLLEFTAGFGSRGAAKETVEPA